MKTKGSPMQLKALQNSDLSRVYAGLNALNNQSWGINQQVHTVIESLWNDGVGFSDIPSRTDFPIPPKPADPSPDEYVAWKRVAGKTLQKNRDLHSLRCDLGYKLQIARDFLSRTFYYPHSLDFRGRTYP